MTVEQFLEAYKQGQRNFQELDFEWGLKGFSDKNFSDTTFENCYLNVDFRRSNLTNTRFINCNLKCADLRDTNLTNALMTKCAVEHIAFKGAKVDGFKFIENYCYSSIVYQTDFDNDFINYE